MSTKDKIEHIDPNKIFPHPENSMKHGDAQVTSLVASFEQFGFNGVIVIDENNVVLAGHGRRLAALRAGMKTVNCLRRVGLSDAQKRAYIIADNKLGRDGEWDQEVLEKQLQQLAGDGFDFESLGISQESLSNLFAPAEKKRGGSAGADGEQAKKRRRSVKAIEDVIAERERQINVEAWTPDHDDVHVNDELSALACAYAMPPGAREWSAESTGYGNTLCEAIVPNGWEFKPADRRQELVKAGALIIAEIERMDRATAAAAAAAKKSAKKGSAA